jgi:hypothetical protein
LNYGFGKPLQKTLKQTHDVFRKHYFDVTKFDIESKIVGLGFVTYLRGWFEVNYHIVLVLLVSNLLGRDNWLFLWLSSGPLRLGGSRCLLGAHDLLS